MNRRVGTVSEEPGAVYRLFDDMPLGVFVLRDGLLVHANAAMSRLTGVARELLVGQPVTALLWEPGPLEEPPDRLARRLGTAPVAGTYEAWLHVGDGGVRVELTVHPHARDWVVQVRDVTCRVRRRMVLRRLAELGSAVRSLHSEDAVREEVFRGLEALELGFAWLTPRGVGVELSVAGLAPRLVPHAPALGGRVRAEAPGGWAPALVRTWRDGDAWVEDLGVEASRFVSEARMDAVLAVFRRAQTHRAVGVRIDVENAPMAMLVLASEWLSEEDVSAVRLFGQQVSAALDAARTIQRLSVRATALTALGRLAAQAASAPHPRAFFGSGTEEISGLLGCDAVCLLLPADTRHEPGEPLELVYSRGLSEDAVARVRRARLGSLPRPGGMPDAVQVLEAEACPAPTRDALRALAFQTLVSVPLRVRSRGVGTLSVLFHARRRLTALEVETLQAMGTHFAAAIESHRLLDEVRGRAEDLALMHEVGKALAATLELDRLLATGVTSLARIVDVPDAYVLLPDAEGQRLAIRAATGGHPELLGREVPLDLSSNSLASQVFRTRQPLRVEDADTEVRVHDELRQAAEGLAYMVLPLAVHDQMVGVAVMVETRRPRRFTPAELERADAIANQLSLALEGARLVEDLKQSYAKLARTQEQLVNRERLAALGELSAVVAHEVRNPLGAIFNSVATIRRIVGPESAATPLLDIVGEEADRLDRMVADLLTFARPPSPHPYPVSVSQLLEEAVGSALSDVGATLPHPVRVEWVMEEGVPPVTVDERLIRQCFLNVALNAVQAMPQGGTLRVVARRAWVDRAGVQVEFCDTGPGIPLELRTRVFEPFFTTKAQGTGLGLALVKRIMDSHLGQVSLDTPETGKGTIFRLFLPLEPPVAPPLPQTGA
ncbi:GAF domain-containing protein [Corallococcus exercitus]|uniref:histidine kinase n=1 Tax=Corallococcus exercitus TaxID=2316736 RepID=A0A7Y4K0Y1_9BACT|nr:GAF domain-containing protein [Corallococcus exercitus]NOK14881.1 GAF domain-containing protein [Corallococcus exercitus]